MVSKGSSRSLQSTKHRGGWRWLWLSIFIILLDQGSKYLADRYLPYGKIHQLFPFFNLWLAYNPGAAFSILGTAGPWRILFLSGISIIVLIILIVWLGRTPRSNWPLAMALSLIVGGAAGNLIDRLRLHYVIDFFDFHLGNWHFYTFNVADAAVTVGAILLIIRLIWLPSES